MRHSRTYSFPTLEARPAEFKEAWGTDHPALEGLDARHYDTIYPGRYHVGFAGSEWRLMGVSYPSEGLVKLATITEDDVRELGLKGKKLLFIQSRRA